MPQDIPTQSLQLLSHVTEGGELRLSLARTPIPAPGPDEIVIRVEGAPINPSDLMLLLGPADLSTLAATGSGEEAVATATIPPPLMRVVAGRVGEALPVGNEGAGVVVDAGPQARDLIGRTVAIMGGAMFSQYRVAKAAEALVLPEGTRPRDAASSFVNPLTALGMIATMRAGGHTALVNTAAASNLGQMLVKTCLKDKVELVNIVRRPEQADLLKALGARHVVDTSSPDFTAELVAALEQTGATVAFDATGGGTLAGQILTAMEMAAVRKGGAAFGRYGSTTFKQVYVYGGLDPSPTVLNRGFGMLWGVSGWFLVGFLQRLAPAEVSRLRQRVVDELNTTFASHYTDEISLAEALKPDVIAAFSRKTTGEKYLINPNKAS